MKFFNEFFKKFLNASNKRLEEARKNIFRSPLTTKENPNNEHGGHIMTSLGYSKSHEKIILLESTLNDENVILRSYQEILEADNYDTVFIISQN